MAQTALDWFLSRVNKTSYDKINKLIEQAKQIEKEQIINAHMYSSGNSSIVEAEYLAEQYYNEVYGGQGSPDTSPNIKNK